MNMLHKGFYVIYYGIVLNRFTYFYFFNYTGVD